MSAMAVTGAVRDEDSQWMRAALEWAEKGRGWSSPRPSVGCVLVRDGQIIGGGHTQPGDGQPHAEVMALRAAAAADPARKARGATAYVTLEPCSHWGTTPPCCDALIAEDISRVVCGIEDPNPLVAGRGLRRLKDAGVEVVEGVLSAQCRRTHEAFLKSIVCSTPFVTLKCALTLDGKIAMPDGHSQWISGPESRAVTHHMRHVHDAILVGIGTVLADDPSLSTRLDEPCKQPVRVVLDSRARLPLDARLFAGAPKVVVVTGPHAPANRVAALESRGADVLQVKGGERGLDWPELLAGLFARGLQSVLVEGGSQVAGSALAAGVVDKVAFFVAPLLLGAGIPALAGFAAPSLAGAPRLTEVWHESHGEDVLISGYLPAFRVPAVSG